MLSGTQNTSLTTYISTYILKKVDRIYAAVSHFFTSIGRIFGLVVDVTIKEPLSVGISAVSFVKYLINPNKYNLNPQRVTPVKPGAKSAKVVILLHGQGGGPFCFFPMAKKFNELKIENVYTVKLKPTSTDPVPLNQLDEKIAEIKEKCHQDGIFDIDFCLIGHSLGSIVSSKKIWTNNTDTKISMMVAIAGRLFYEKSPSLNPYFWFCQDVKPEIEKTYASYKQDPYLADLYTIRGQKDKIVPEGSSFIHNNPQKKLTVEGFGHGGILYSEEAIVKTAEWTRSWVAAATQSEAS